jgi:hypothetical protein
VKAAHMAILFGLLEFFAGATGATPGVARFAHLGGMVTGYLYIRWWWVWKLNAVNWAKAALGQAERGSSGRRAPRRAPAKRPAEAAAGSDMAEVDRILDKILASGEASLTDEEKKILQRYSERNKPS